MEAIQPDPDKIKTFETDKLYLDEKNPRLAWRVRDEETTQLSLLEVLWEQMAVDELVLSIAENGFFASEPLFIIPREDDTGGFTVVEGNRRLAAVRILRNPDIREQLGVQSIPDAEEGVIDSISNLPCIYYDSRESLWETVGFRHINGIQQWDSFSKAEYVSEVHEKYDVSLQEIARKVGDTHSTVQRLYAGFKLIEQAEKEGIFDTDNTYLGSLYFSHLYTAADQRGYQEFLGIDSEDLQGPDPIDEENLDNLKELLTWLYGNKNDNIEPVVETQNPDLRRLRKVLQDAEALATLRATGSLDDAHDTAVGEDKLFNDNLIQAKQSLKSAMSNVTSGYDGSEDLFNTMKDIVNITKRLYQNMKQTRKDNMDEFEGIDL